MSDRSISWKHCIALFNFCIHELFLIWHRFSASSTVVMISVNFPFFSYTQGKCLQATTILHIFSKPALSTLLNNSRVGKRSNSRITKSLRGRCSLHAHGIQCLLLIFPGITRWSYFYLGGKICQLPSAGLHKVANPRWATDTACCHYTLHDTPTLTCVPGIYYLYTKPGSSTQSSVLDSSVLFFSVLVATCRIS